MLNHLFQQVWFMLFPPDRPLDFITLLVLSNIVLSSIHSFLEWLHPKTKNTWDDRLYRLTGYLLALMEWAMAARVGKKLAPRDKTASKDEAPPR